MSDHVNVPWDRPEAEDEEPRPAPEGLTPTPRGFLRSEAIEGHYGGKIGAMESSGHTPCIWVDVEEPDDLNEFAHAKITDQPYTKGFHSARILLKLRDAIQFRDHLTALIDNHFLKDLPEEEWG